jgi:hypothetical protein
MAGSARDMNRCMQRFHCSNYRGGRKPGREDSVDSFIRCLCIALASG